MLAFRLMGVFARNPWAAVWFGLSLMALVGITTFSGVGVTRWIAHTYAERGHLAERDKTDCRKEEVECNERDLMAQVRSADASEALVDLSLWQFLLSVVGTLALLVTLIQTIKGTAAAVRAANAAEASVEVTRGVGMRQSRAYLAVLPGPVIAQDENHLFEVDLLVKNTGQTPAMNLGFTTGMVLAPNPLPADYRFPFETLEPLKRGTTLGSDETVIMFRTFNRWMDPAEYAEINDSHMPLKVYVFGTLEYDDVFETTHYIQFCRLVMLTDRGPVFFVTPGWNHGN